MSLVSQEQASKQLLSVLNRTSGLRVIWWGLDGIIQGGDPVALDYFSQQKPCVGFSAGDVLGDEVLSASRKIVSGETEFLVHKLDGEQVLELSAIRDENKIVGILCCQTADSPENIFVSRQALEMAIETYVHNMVTPLQSAKSLVQTLQKILPSFTIDSDSVSPRYQQLLEKFPERVDSLLKNQQIISQQIRLLLYFINDYRVLEKKNIALGVLIETAFSQNAIGNFRESFDVDIRDDGNIFCVERAVVALIQLLMNTAIYYQNSLSEKVTFTTSADEKNVELTCKFEAAGITEEDAIRLVSEPLHLEYAHITGAAYEQMRKIMNYHDGSIHVNVVNENKITYRLVFKRTNNNV